MMRLNTKKFFFFLGFLGCLLPNAYGQTIELTGSAKNSSKCPVAILMQNDKSIFLGHSVGFEITDSQRLETFSKEEACSYSTTQITSLKNKKFDFKAFDIKKIEKRTDCVDLKLNGVVEHSIVKNADVITYKNVFYQLPDMKNKSEFKCIYKK